MNLTTNKVRIIRLLLCLAAGVLFSASAFALPATRIEDTLFNADGSTVEGQVTIEWKPFTASDGATLPASAITVNIAQGALVVDLVPNEDATPQGTSYKVTYLLGNGRKFVETWVVPVSSEPVTVSDVRVLQPPPPPDTVIAQSQVVGLIADLNFAARVRRR